MGKMKSLGEVVQKELDDYLAARSEALELALEYAPDHNEAAMGIQEHVDLVHEKSGKRIPQGIIHTAQMILLERKALVDVRPYHIRKPENK